MNTHDFITKAREIFNDGEQMEIVDELCANVGPCDFLKDARADCLKLQQICEELVSTCDSAPPVEFITRIGEVCEMARTAIAKVKVAE